MQKLGEFETDEKQQQGQDFMNWDWTTNPWDSQNLGKQLSLHLWILEALFCVIDAKCKIY